ncbi:RluA family pseudouridine synthase [Streptomyces sp. NPDC059009]|uniref:RluA family pseudouridine synthase n=1 Tax=Streptomyces sp. NPDC059009 TaxID=3346694 RepID=UPI0036AA2E9C
MRRKPNVPPPPLPQRRGIDPRRLRLPQTGPWGSVRDYLVERLSGAGAAVIDGMLDEGRIVGADGVPVAPDAPFAPGAYIWFHRELADEPTVPYGIDIVHRDEHIVVADKPHFLATTPRGSHITQTALARLRTELGLPALGAAHRLDRLTAGLVLFTVQPGERGAYQRLFGERQVYKEYEAVAAHDPSVPLPRTVRSHIQKDRGIIAAYEIPDAEPNSESRVELAEHKGALGRYRLVPHTGRTHQLRVHMNTLGLPLLGDPVYPVVADPVAPDDFRRPLQLLARVLEFTDPVTGVAHRFVSGRELAAWTSYENWRDAPAPPDRDAPAPPAQ